jgi:hypothetical protein
MRKGVAAAHATRELEAWNSPLCTTNELPGMVRTYLTASFLRSGVDPSFSTTVGRGDGETKTLIRTSDQHSYRSDRMIDRLLSGKEPTGTCEYSVSFTRTLNPTASARLRTAHNSLLKTSSRWGKRAFIIIEVKSLTGFIVENCNTPTAYGTWYTMRQVDKKTQKRSVVVFFFRFVERSEVRHQMGCGICPGERYPTIAWGPGREGSE